MTIGCLRCRRPSSTAPAFSHLSIILRITPSQAHPSIRFVLLTAMTMVVILYGSLYPFEFRIPVEGGGPLSTLLHSWRAMPGRGDFVANVLLYMPLGWFGFLSLSQRMSVWLRLFFVVMGGAALSASIELTQYY